MSNVKFYETREVSDLEELYYVVANNPMVVVDVFTGWCLPCKKVAPKYKEMGQYYGKHGIIFLKVDGELSEDRMLRFNGMKPIQITGFPMFLFFHNGQLVKVGNEDRIMGGDIKLVDTWVKKIFLN